MITHCIAERLEATSAATAAVLDETDSLLGLFNRRLSQRLVARLWASCADCEPSYCAAAAAAYVLEGDGVWVEPKPCPACDGWKLVPSTKEAPHAA